jgi:hypothetical protein
MSTFAVTARLSGSMRTTVWLAEQTANSLPRALRTWSGTTPSGMDPERRKLERSETTTALSAALATNIHA